MMSEYLMLAIGSFSFGLVVAYCMWAKVRGIILRQDFFEIRDGLWDKANALNGLDDPAYRYVREMLNTNIRGGHAMSLPLIYAFRHTRAMKSRPTSAIPELEFALQETEAAAFKRMWRYISRDRFGSFVGGLLYIRSLKAAKKVIAIWNHSVGPSQVAELADRERRRMAAV